MDMTSLPNIWNKYLRWCRLLILIHQGGEYLCKNILYKMGVKDVTDGAEIYSRLKQYEKEIKQLGMNLQKTLLPDDKIIDTKEMDISLSTYIIQIMDKPQDYPSIAKLRQKRIELLYMREAKRNMTEQQFNTYWNEISEMLSSLHYKMDLINCLKTEDNLAQKYEKILKDINQKLQGTIALIHGFFLSFLSFLKVMCSKHVLWKY